MDNEQIGNVTQAYFTNARTGETIELQGLPEGGYVLDCEEPMCLSWDSDGVAYLDLS
jgi:hypothetical protein